MITDVSSFTVIGKTRGRIVSHMIFSQLDLERRKHVEFGSSSVTRRLLSFPPQNIYKFHWNRKETKYEIEV